MRLLEIIRAVFLNIKENKFRVFLTSLGIIVGSLTIIIVVGIGTASQEAIEEQFKQLTVDSITIMKNRDSRNVDSLTYEDAMKLKEQAQYVRDVSVVISSSVSVTSGTDTQSLNIMGVNGEYFPLNNLNLEVGEFFTSEQIKRQEKVIIIGHDLAEAWFGSNSADAIGEKVIMSGRKFEIVGVIEYQGGGSMWNNPDEALYGTYDVVKKYYAGRRDPNISAFALDMESVPLAMEEIPEVLDDITKGHGDAFQLRDMGQILESATESSKFMSLLLISVACIVLIVGGIGIMNVLFVSVKERTKEIGILKSIGASRRDILLEFLIESIVISITGGVIGAGLSIAIIPLFKYTELSVIPSSEGIILGLVFSIVTGTFFGYYPAVKASQLKPIDALNYE